VLTLVTLGKPGKKLDKEARLLLLRDAKGMNDGDWPSEAKELLLPQGLSKNIANRGESSSIPRQ
jgi:hypothetical protein